MGVVQVAVALPLHEAFTYQVPAGLPLRLGHAVLVPFGRRKVTGYVVGPGSMDGLDPSKLKPVDRLLDPEPAFDATQLGFFRWVAEYYRSGLGEVIATALPAEMKAKTRGVHRATEEGIEGLNVGEVEGEEAEVLRELIHRPGLTRRGLTRRLRDLVESKPAERALDRLVRKGLVEREQEEVGGPGGQVRVVRLVVDGAAARAALGRVGARQEAVIAMLEQAGGSMDKAALVAEQGPYARTALKRLMELGAAAEELREARDAVVLGELPDNREPPTLTPKQLAAVESICGPPRAWLLFGVTGAGKTEVYLRAAQRVLDKGLQVLVLVPEIGLTPLLTGRFRARFGDSVAVLHSGLTGAERLREWRRIRAGEAQVTVGARSALFAPFTRLGMVVVDEEHDDSYKQDDGVRYSARDLAVVRGKLAGCPVVLGSATPSLESWFNAEWGRYGRIELLDRPTPRPVPQVELVDMNVEPRVDGKPPLVSQALRASLQRCFHDGGKAIVLYNRRGYATFVQCPDCGSSYSCPSCGVGLVLHQRQHTLTCHYCGFHRPFRQDCVSCGGALDVLGRGTERVEEQLSELFPDVPIGRMDADTTAVRGAHFKILERFRTGEIKMLVGTQIVAKGHDFPDVHVAAVLGADHVLGMPDFRSSERTFSLLTQLAGRAGRGDVAGRVFVQTHHAEHFVFQTLGDFPEFARQEARQRELLRYPPFARMALLRVESADRMKGRQAAWKLVEDLQAKARGTPIQVLGPAQAALPRLVGRWRLQILLRGPDPAAFRDWLRRSVKPGVHRGVRVILDVDPRSLM